MGDSDIIKLEEGYSDGDVGSSDVSKKGGSDGGRGKTGDGKVYREVGTRRSQYLIFN